MAKINHNISFLLSWYDRKEIILKIISAPMEPRIEMEKRKIFLIFLISIDLSEKKEPELHC